jgi:hypothetical protein
MGKPRTDAISEGVRAWQASVTGVLAAVGVEVGVAVGSVGAEEWQPRSKRDAVRSMQSGVVDIFRWPSWRPAAI